MDDGESQDLLMGFTLQCKIKLIVAILFLNLQPFEVEVFNNFFVQYYSAIYRLSVRTVGRPRERFEPGTGSLEAGGTDPLDHRTFFLDHLTSITRPAPHLLTQSPTLPI